MAQEVETTTGRLGPVGRRPEGRGPERLPLAGTRAGVTGEELAHPPGRLAGPTSPCSAIHSDFH